MLFGCVRYRRAKVSPIFLSDIFLSPARRFPSIEEVNRKMLDRKMWRTPFSRLTTRVRCQKVASL